MPRCRSSSCPLATPSAVNGRHSASAAACRRRSGRRTRSAPTTTVSAGHFPSIWRRCEQGNLIAQLVWEPWEPALSTTHLPRQHHERLLRLAHQLFLLTGYVVGVSVRRRCVRQSPGPPYQSVLPFHASRGGCATPRLGRLGRGGRRQRLVLLVVRSAVGSALLPALSFLLVYPICTREPQVYQAPGVR
jgi:hypothetical protein